MHKMLLTFSMEIDMINMLGALWGALVLCISAAGDQRNPATVKTGKYWNFEHRTRTNILLKRDVREVRTCV